MRQYARVDLARKYLQEVMGIQPVGICLREEQGVIEFAFPSRYMLMGMQSIQKKVPHIDYRFERTAHYIADVFVIDRHRTIRLQINYGSQRAVATLFDTEEQVDDLKESK